MPKRSETDPIACCNTYLATLGTQLDNITPLPSEIYEDIEKLRDQVPRLDEGNTDPREIIKGTIELFWAHWDTLSNRSAGKTLTDFGYRLAELTDIDREEVNTMWEEVGRD